MVEDKTDTNIDSAEAVSVHIATVATVVRKAEANRGKIDSTGPGLKIDLRTDPLGVLGAEVAAMKARSILWR